jgi:hypothetical protein
MRQRTSNIPMRLFVTALAVLLYGMTACGPAFACPRMSAAPGHEEPCSDCPKEEKCPREACMLLCPYTVEKTAVVTPENHDVPVLPAVAFAPQLPSPAHALSYLGHR